jgi:hypothetical protein
MKKRIGVLVLVMSILLINSFSFADSLGDDVFLLDSIIIQSKTQIEQADGPAPLYTDPGVGAVRIDDLVMSSSSIVNVITDEHYATYEISKLALVKIIKNVPVVGDVYSRGEDIYNDLKNVYSIMSNINSQKAVDYTTKYSTRNFYHYLYVWDDAQYWYDAGYSLSKYYYKHLSMVYIDNDGEAWTKHYDFNYTNGSEPEEVAEAAHYMDKDYLAQKAVEKWQVNQRYVETYIGFN